MASIAIPPVFVIFTIIPEAFSPIIFYIIPFPVSPPPALHHKANVEDAVAQISRYLTQAEFDTIERATSLAAPVSSEVTGTPESGQYYTLFRQWFGGNYCTDLVIDINSNDFRMFGRNVTNGLVRLWTRIATAMPPVEHDLPLAEGVEKWGTAKCSFSKDQFGKVLVHFAVKKQDGSAFSRDNIFAVLPKGYRPSAYVYGVGMCHSVSPVLTHAIGISAAGNMVIYPNSTALPTTIIGTLEFLSAS